ncbi:chorismate synthase [Myxococcota bacterium]|nr:chorismate synthase [Myxococcota bacterium]
MTSTTGTVFRVTTFGESHGPAVGAVVDGCPPGIPLGPEAIQRQLDRRRPGQSPLTTRRDEADRVEVLSGVFEGRTLGTPIALLVRNRDADASPYESMRHVYRPSHADYTVDARYGARDWRGGGRASARETVGRVAAGAVAREVLRHLFGVEVVGWVDRIAGAQAQVDPGAVAEAEVDAHPTRCPDPGAAASMEEAILAARREGDTVGGVVAAVARGVPPGWGEPVFDKLHADLGRAILSIPACKGFEVGSGFGGAGMRGSEHNDGFYMEGDRVRTRTNRSGGVQGGISNGEAILVRAAFKPVATVFVPQRTVTDAGEEVELRATGRHDPCVLPRAVPVVEAMIALVLLDHALRRRAQVG